MDERIMFTKEALRLGVSKGCRGNSGPTAGPKLYASLTQICEVCEVCKKSSCITGSILYRWMLHFWRRHQEVLLAPELPIF